MNDPLIWKSPARFSRKSSRKETRFNSVPLLSPSLKYINTRTRASNNYCGFLQLQKSHPIYSQRPSKITMGYTDTSPVNRIGGYLAIHLCVYADEGQCINTQ